MLLAFLCLTYFTELNAIKVYPCFYKWQDVLLRGHVMYIMTIMNIVNSHYEYE